MKRITASSALLVLVACSAETEFRGTSADKINPRLVLDQEFPAAVVGETKVTFKPLYGLVDEQLTLREKPPVTTTLKQKERTVAVDSYTQGNDGDFSEETFDISAAGKLDLILVVDDSASMSEEQKTLAADLKSLTKFLDNTDWQIGIVTTSTKTAAGASLPCQLKNAATPGKPIKRGDATAETNFFNTINGLGTNGSPDEQGIAQALRVVNDKCGTTWLRPDASLSVLFLSDEDNYCSTTDCKDPDNNPAGAINLVTAMRAARTDDKLKAYALLYKPAETKCVNAVKHGEESYGQRYHDVIFGTTAFTGLGGIEGLICVDKDSTTADYQDTLERISKDVARSVKREFPLKYTPASGTAQVMIDGVASSDYEITGKMLVLKNPDANQVKLKVSYRYDPKPKFDRVKVQAAPAASTLEISVDGQPLDPAKWTYDDQTQEVQFVDQPADNAKVKLTYRKDEPLPKDFDLGAGGVPAGEILGVKVGGQAPASWGYDSATRTLSLDNAPNDGVEVTVTVKLADALITHYPAGAGQQLDLVKGYTVKDADSGAEVQATLANGEIVVPKDQVVDGRALVVTYDYGDSSTVLSHELAYEPLDGTLKVTEGTEADDCINNVTVAGKSLTFTCDAATLGEVAVEYKYVAERYSSFTVSPSIPANAYLTVYVDGGATGNYVRNGDTITIPAELLSLDSKVRVIATVDEVAK